LQVDCSCAFRVTFCPFYICISNCHKINYVTIFNHYLVWIIIGMLLELCPALDVSAEDPLSALPEIIQPCPDDTKPVTAAKSRASDTPLVLNEATHGIEALGRNFDFFRILVLVVATSRRITRIWQPFLLTGPRGRGPAISAPRWRSSCEPTPKVAAEVGRTMRIFYCMETKMHSCWPLQRAQFAAPRIAPPPAVLKWHDPSRLNSSHRWRLGSLKMR
jgi:hypothetical protein